MKIGDVDVSMVGVIDDEATTTRRLRPEIVDVVVSLIGVINDDPTTTRSRRSSAMLEAW